MSFSKGSAVRFFSDTDSFVWNTVGSILWNTLTVTIVFGCFYYFDYRARETIAGKLTAQIETVEHTLDNKQVEIEETSRRLTAQIDARGNELARVEDELKKIRRAMANHG